MILEINVKTGSKKGPLVEKNEDDSLTLFIREKPHDGEANEAVVRLLSDYLKIPKTSIKIIAGTKSHHKKIEF